MTIRIRVPSAAISAVLSAGLLASAFAAVSPEEASHLGKDLTPWGAEVAGNKDGSIPPYTGGQRALPPGFKPDGGGKRWIDPYASEKPVVSITADNMAQYEDKLLGSSKELFKRYPKTFRMDVYPTHRSVWYPDWTIKEMLKNASAAQLVAGGYGVANSFGPSPFPIPKSGFEVWWNHEFHYKGAYMQSNVGTWMMDSTGHKSLNGAFMTDSLYPIFDQGVGREKFLADGGDIYYKVYNDYTAPSSRVGEVNLYHHYTNQVQNPAKAWVYTTGTRRVRTAPDLFFDTPCPGYNGGITMDDIQMTWGPQTHTNWKLMGKKEIYIPYNNYTQQFATPSEHTLTPNHPNPDDIRWELHRVWVIEGSPVAGARHLYSKKVVYFDEDQGGTEMEDYDHANKLFRGGWSTMVMLYDVGVPYDQGNFFFDFSTATYWMGSHPGDKNVKGLFYPKDDSWRKSRGVIFSPEYMQANGIR